MNRDFPRDWMWSEACEMLARADRLHRELFRPLRSGARAPAWEPPVDILETEREVLVLAALPGVKADEVEASIENGDLRISGTRVLPGALRTAVIHRLELPRPLQRRAACVRRRLPTRHAGQSGRGTWLKKIKCRLWAPKKPCRR
jgi:HSP20 family molecular chaperone IbpA